MYLYSSKLRQMHGSTSVADAQQQSGMKLLLVAIFLAAVRENQLKLLIYAILAHGSN